LIISLLFLILYVIFLTKIITYSSVYNEQDNDFTGTIIDYKIDGDKFSFILKSKEKLQVSYYFKNLEEKKDFLSKIKLGQTLKVIGKLAEPNRNTIPNTFNYQEYLYGKKIYWIVNAEKIIIDNESASFLYKTKNFFTIGKTNRYRCFPTLNAHFLYTTSYS